MPFRLYPPGCIRCAREYRGSTAKGACEEMLSSRIVSRSCILRELAFIFTSPSTPRLVIVCRWTWDSFHCSLSRGSGCVKFPMYLMRQVASKPSTRTFGSNLDPVSSVAFGYNRVFSLRPDLMSDLLAALGLLFSRQACFNLGHPFVQLSFEWLPVVPSDLVAHAMCAIT